MGTPTIVRSFAAGEVSPGWGMRADLPFYAHAAKRLLNFIVSRSGAASVRPGTVHGTACKTDDSNVKLVPFVSEVDGDSVVIEFGDGYLRFLNDNTPVTVDIGGLDAYDVGTAYAIADLVSDSGVAYYAVQASTGQSLADPTYWAALPGDVYEIPCPFNPSTTKTVQSGKLITFTSHDVRTQDLHYTDRTHWYFDVVTTAPTVEPPADVVLTADGIDSTHTAYDITVVVVDDGGDVSAAGAWSGELPTVDSGHHGFISWRAPLLGSGGPNIDHYEVYVGGSYVGSASGTDYEWDGSTPGGGTSGGVSSIAAPRNVAAEGTSDDPTVTPFRYVVTAIDPVSGQESLASAIVTGDLTQPEVTPHRITWTEELVGGTPVPEYRVYQDKANGGAFYYIGNTSSLAFVNTGLAQDTNRTPPTTAPGTIDPDDPSTFPAVAAYFQQRRFIGNTTSTPDAVRASKTGDYSNFTVSTPLQDSDGIAFRLSGNNNHDVRWLVALKQLLVMTGGGEWVVFGNADGALTPSDIRADQQTYAGVSDLVPPVAVGSSVVYVQARNKILRELEFTQQVEGLAGRDLTFFASHLVDDYMLVSLAFQQNPNALLWAVRDDGALLGLTYLPEHDMLAWHRHTALNTRFEYVVTIPETDRDALYCLVERDGHRYIERLSTAADAVRVDGAVVYEGAATAALSGLNHLEGQTVAVYADGAVRDSVVVASGTATFAAAYSNIIVGLPITAQLQPVDLDGPGATVIRGAKKRVGWAAIVLDASARDFSLGPSFDKLTPFVDQAEDSFSGIVELSLVSSYDYPGSVCLEHARPTPLTVLGFIPSVDL